MALPKAIKEIPTDCNLLCRSLLAIMAIFPWQQLPVNKSPFVTVFQMVGIKWAAGLINFVVLTAAVLEFHPLFNRRYLYQIKKKHQTAKAMNLFETE